MKRFGEIPDPGPERGEYFIRLKNSFVDPKLGSLAAKIVADRIQGLVAFVQFVKKGNLMKVKETMLALVKAIDNK